jgi:hypothetical protein
MMNEEGGLSNNESAAASSGNLEAAIITVRIIVQLFLLHLLSFFLSFSTSLRISANFNIPRKMVEGTCLVLDKISRETFSSMYPFPNN